MTRKKILLILLLGVMGVFTTSCKNDDGKKPVNPVTSTNLADFITEYNWYIIDKNQITENGKPYVDISQDGKIDDSDLNFYEDEEISLYDSYYVFKKDGTFVINEGKHAPEGKYANEDIIKGTWSIKGESFIFKVSYRYGETFEEPKIVEFKISKDFTIPEKHSNQDKVFKLILDENKFNGFPCPSYKLQYTYGNRIRKGAFSE